jgi:hypothetical protein
MKRRSHVRARRRRSGSVDGGMVETVYSTVVGEGRRVWRFGVVVSIFRGAMADLINFEPPKGLID